MEDPLTEDPPPSRFFDEDLNNFTPPSPPLPLPTLQLSTPTPLNPSLLLIAISSPSIHLIHRITSKTLIGTLTLPEITSSPNPNSPSPKDKSCYIFSLTNNKSSILLVSVQYSVPPERSHAVAKFLFEQIQPEKVLIFDTIQSRNFRGRLPPDEELMLKMETLEEKCSGDCMVKGFEYFPSGSLIDGLSAAMLARCQLKKIRGTLCVSWPEMGRSAVLIVKNLMQSLLPEVDLGAEKGDVGLYRVRDSRSNSEMYT